ncbi:MAG: class I SAM-dependent methyltransferase [Paludibacteraceae bacterium]|nr:class I SAM-dependent methyltransferase [Paludibacteraceae bacterium]
MKEKIVFKSAVSPTLLIPLFVRAQESKRNDAILFDKMAEKLLDSIDYDFSLLTQNFESALCCVIRARYFDDCLIDYCKNHDRVVIVNVGCGLDTRFQRIGSKAKATYYDLDLPDVIELRRKLIPESENNIFLSGSVLDNDWLKFLYTKHKNDNIVFVFEGVLMYFDKKDIIHVFNSITSHFSKGELYFEMFGNRIQASGIDAMEGFNVSFKCYESDSNAICDWNKSLTLVEQKAHTDIFPERWGLKGVLSALSPKMGVQEGSLFRFRIN